MATEVSNGRTLLSKLHPRLTVLQRAVEVLEAPDQASVILRGVGAGELGFTRQVVQILQEDPRVLRQVRVALNQWTQAQKGVASAEAVLSQAAAFPEAHRAAFVAEHCHVEKLRGQLYPLINLHVVFRETPILSQLVPAPKPGYREKTPAPKPLDAASAVRTSTAPGQVQTSIEDEVKAVDAAISQVVGSIKQATGTLKNKLKGFFGGVPTENE